MTVQELQAYLSKFGTLVYCRIATDYQGNSKGYAFASFSTEEENAASLGKYKINNLTFEIKKSVNREENIQLHKSVQERKVFFNKISENISTKDLFRYFRSFGKIQELTLLKNPKT